MEDIYYKIVEHIFSNWTALKLAVEHGMAGPNSQQVATDCIKYIVQYCLNESNIQVEDIEEAIEDIMDQEFDTVCEDNSPKEIAMLLHRFLGLLKEGNITQCELEYKNLPTNKECLVKSQPQIQLPQQPQAIEKEVIAEVSNAEVEMVDSEWVQVKGRKKR